MQIRLFFKDIAIKLPERKKLKLFLLDLFITEGKCLDTLTYIFCTDEYLLSINQEFLGHYDYTDIITFTLSEPGDPLIGEIYISVDRVKDNAFKFKVQKYIELHRVIFHGALHLCGYKDKLPIDKKNMTAAEDRYLKLYIS